MKEPCRNPCSWKEVSLWVCEQIKPDYHIYHYYETGAVIWIWIDKTVHKKRCVFMYMRFKHQLMPFLKAF